MPFFEDSCEYFAHQESYNVYNNYNTLCYLIWNELYFMFFQLCFFVTWSVTVPPPVYPWISYNIFNVNCIVLTSKFTARVPGCFLWELSKWYYVTLLSNFCYNLYTRLNNMTCLLKYNSTIRNIHIIFLNYIKCSKSY